MNIEKQKILDKVVKLIALSEGTHSPEEAASAKEMAADLMAKYDISIIEGSQDSQFTESMHKLTRKAPIEYDTVLIGIISRFNGVAHLVRTQGNKRAYNIYVGREADMECNMYMIDILLQQRLVGWKKYLAWYKSEYQEAPDCTSKKRWMMGFAIGVMDKLEELTRMKDAKIQEYGLVPVNSYEQAMEDYKSRNETTEGRNRDVNYNAEGYQAGKEAHIHKGIVSQSKTRQIA